MHSSQFADGLALKAYIDQAVASSQVGLSVVRRVLSNHTETTIPTTTTAITTGLTTIGSGALTLRGGLGVRVLAQVQLNALNTLQAIVTPTLTITVNGAGTTTQVLPAMAMPGNTSSPTVAVLPVATDVYGLVGEVAGATVNITLGLTGSTTGVSAPATVSTLSLQEIF